MKEWAKSFYTSSKWAQCRKAYRKYRGGLCEVCLARGIYNAGEIVHHKTHLTAENINDPNITMGFDNLQLVCRQCHADIHEGKQRRYRVEEDGRIVPLV